LADVINGTSAKGDVLPFSSKPILDVEAADAFELVHIGGHDRSAGRIGVGRDEQIVAADRLSGCFQYTISAGDGDNKARSSGSTKETVKTIAQGKLGVPVTCGFYSRALLSHARLRVQRAPGFPCALQFEAKACKPRAHFAARSRPHVDTFVAAHTFSWSILRPAQPL
jgi:hypothetical protein